MSNNRKRKGRAVSGIVILDKPQGLSSNAALQRVKRLFNANKAGHTGSLDPLATGVLPLCLGEATKVSQFLLDSDKKYRATVKLGVRTDSADAEGNVIATSQMDLSGISTKAIAKALEEFRGETQQLPPMYSALKVDGVPLYKLARKGQEIQRQTRAVTIYDIELLDRNDDQFTFEVSCSKGTYIRTLADDVGERLGCGGHIVALRRLQAGAFEESQSICLKRLEEIAAEPVEEDEAENKYQLLDNLLRSTDEAVDHLPKVMLPQIATNSIKQGQAVLARHLPAEGLVRIYDEDCDSANAFIGIGIIDDDGRVAPKRLLQTGSG